MYVVCFDHLETAIDEFVELNEKPPDLYLLEQVSSSDWSVPDTCQYCCLSPKYLVV
ncbi:MAG: CxxH/CxxC protein [Bacillota bacterium]